MTVKWTLSFRTDRPGQEERMEAEAARSWELIQRLRGLHPTLDPWRESDMSKAKAAANPEITTLEEFLAVTSPHWAQAGALATASYPTANGAVFTYGTPDTYPTILNTWPTV